MSTRIRRLLLCCWMVQLYFAACGARVLIMLYSFSLVYHCSFYVSLSLYIYIYIYVCRFCLSTVVWCVCVSYGLCAWNKLWLICHATVFDARHCCVTRDRYLPTWTLRGADGNLPQDGLISHLTRRIVMYWQMKRLRYAIGLHCFSCSVYSATAHWPDVTARCFVYGDFYRATACNATRGIAVAIVSVCPSDACIVTKLNNALRIFWYHTKRQSL